MRPIERDLLKLLVHRKAHGEIIKKYYECEELWLEDDHANKPDVTEALSTITPFGPLTGTIVAAVWRQWGMGFDYIEGILQATGEPITTSQIIDRLVTSDGSTYYVKTKNGNVYKVVTQEFNKDATLSCR